MADDAGIINQVLTETSFLYGANAAFVEDLYARWAENPGSVEPSWAAFFATLSDQADQVKRAAQDPAWTPRQAPAIRPEWLSAIDGQWPTVAPAVEAKMTKAIEAKAPGTSAEAVRAATLDSLRAIMMIRAYRMRGHLAANLDPLGLEPKPAAPELDPATYGFSEADYDRPIFLDFVLGIETSTIREILSILRRTYCDNVGVQYMHISDPNEKAWLQERIEGRDKEIVFSKEGKVAILKKLIEAEGFETLPAQAFPGHQALRPRRRRSLHPGAGTDHQARRRAGCEGHRHRHAAPRSPEHARGRDGQALPRDLPRVPGRLVQCPRTSRARATSSTTWAPRRTASSTTTRSTCR
jgi:2-oxoglutarate dehydrogenase E1 component